MFPSSNAQLFFQGVGIALVASAMLGFAQRLFFYDDFKSEVDTLIGTALDTYLAKNVLPFLKEGFERLYTDRNEAINEFRKHLLLESDHIVIIGSSLKGLLDVTERDKNKKKLADTIREKMSSGVRVEFLLTHPALAFLREDAEGRKPGAIKAEIIETIRYLTGENIGGQAPNSNLKIPLEAIRLYLGTPTIFAVICSDWMLVNPYAYQATAYDNFCFEISQKSEQGLYSKIFKSHYKEPWDNKDTTRTIDKDELPNLPALILSDVFPNRIDDLVHKNQQP